MKTKPIPRDKLTALIDAIECPKVKALALITSAAGLRISEALSLTPKSIGRDFVHVQKKNTKGKVSARTIPVNPDIVVQFLTLSRAEEYAPDRKLFTFSRFKAYQEIKKAAGKVGLENVGTHGFRKTFASNVYSLSGSDLRLTQLALGHKSVASTIHYLEVDADRLKETILKAQALNSVTLAR